MGRSGWLCLGCWQGSVFVLSDSYIDVNFVVIRKVKHSCSMHFSVHLYILEPYILYNLNYEIIYIDMYV